VVCSSLAAMLYDLPSVGWAHPDLGAERRCEPADWWLWSQARAWSTRSPVVINSLCVAAYFTALVRLLPIAGQSIFRWTFHGPWTQIEVR